MSEAAEGQKGPAMKKKLIRAGKKQDLTLFTL